MPQPLPVGKTVGSGPNRILERPELAALVGNVCANWSLIENDMVLLYGLLMGTYLPRAEIPGMEFGPPTHPVAYQVFDALIAFPQRLSLLQHLARWRALPEEAQQLDGPLGRRIRDRYRDRSKVAHAQWGICND